ncbi:polysaccharide deacetylase family protein [Thioalkalivibrio sulfidiphilus]|uniref:polysaccharide deacetylase family protein n=1 Tax=Thioalkalivibrio sulfidiphilus TaxID=1033854 RepID=UPI003B34FCBE
MMRDQDTAGLPPGLAPPPEVGRVYLSFDDGPDARWTPRILDLLAQANVPATFFVVGRRALEQPALVRRIAAHGYALGNHTWSHRHPWTMRASSAREEVRAGAAAIADLIGRAPQFFRPPHGRLRRCMLEEAERGGQALMLWDLSAVDWGPLGVARAIARRLAATQAGDIVLMHDGGQGINRPRELIEALPGFLAGLRRRGLVPSLFAAPRLMGDPGSRARDVEES